MLSCFVCQRFENSLWTLIKATQQQMFRFHQFFVLLLLEPPCIIEKPESLNVLPGSKVQFNTLVYGTPPLKIKWFKNNKEIVSSADCSVVKDNTSSSLELFFAKTTDSGDYICEIQNDVGSTSCQATLFVKGCQLSYNTKQQINILNLFPFICSEPPVEQYRFFLSLI